MSNEDFKDEDLKDEDLQEEALSVAETKEEKAAKAAKAAKAKDTQETHEKGRIVRFFGDIKAEYSKIVWSKRSHLVKQTFTVIVTSLMFGAVIAIMDFVLKFGYDRYIGLFR